MIKRAVPLILLLPLFAGCTVGPGYPSLLPRTVESSAASRDETADAPDSPTTANPALDPAVASTLAAILAAGDSAKQTFESERSSAGAAVTAASGALQGSESWVAGQQALSRLYAARGAIAAALADLDSLSREQAGADAATQAALGDARGRLERIDADQAAAIAELAARVG